MLQAVVALVDHRGTNVDEFVELAVERAADAGVEAQEVLEHVRAMRQRFLNIAGFAFELLLVDFFYFERSLLGFDKCDACHEVSPPFVGYNTRQRLRSSSQSDWSSPLTCFAFVPRPLPMCLG